MPPRIGNFGLFGYSGPEGVADSAPMTAVCHMLVENVGDIDLLCVLGSDHRTRVERDQTWFVTMAFPARLIDGYRASFLDARLPPRAGEVPKAR